MRLGSRRPSPESETVVDFAPKSLFTLRSLDDTAQGKPKRGEVFRPLGLVMACA